MIKTKTFYSLKSATELWTPLSTPEIKAARINNDFDVIEIIMQLVTLYGLIFPTKVPPFIIVNNYYYFLTIQYIKTNRIIVGYASSAGDFYKSFESDKEKKAKKALASFLKSKGIG